MPQGKRQPREVICHWLTTIEEEGKYLTSWEEGFVAGLVERFANSSIAGLSEREEEILEKIYTEKTP